MDSREHSDQNVKENSVNMDCEQNKEDNVSCSTAIKNHSLEEQLLDCVVASNAVFKSQQKDEPEMSVEEKRKIAANLLRENRCLFLSKFGHCLKPEHLSYFDQDKEDNYEASHYIRRLQRYFDSSKRQIDVKNRRYQALKLLIKEGEYFSEREMMKRNPCLYEQLVGQYLTEDQKRTRDRIDKKDISYVNILMESIDRSRMQERIEGAEEEEEEEEEEEKEEEEEEEDISQGDKNQEKNLDNKDFMLTQSNEKEGKPVQWGEGLSLQNTTDNKKFKKQINFEPWHQISEYEKETFRKEFEAHMYQSFLDGKDNDFDYSTVDNNEVYDDIDLRTQDEEEKYFDSESPEIVSPKNAPSPDESEDELDVYMNSLKVE